MKRNLQWGVLALAPLVLTIYFSSMLLNDSSYVPSFAEGNLFLTDYWWSILAGLSFIPWVILFTHLIKNKTISVNKKILWVIGMLVISIYLIPIYWFLHSANENA